MRKKQEPTPQQMAAEGDIFGLLQFAREYPMMLRTDEIIRLLRRAVAAAGQNDMDECVRSIYRLMIEFTMDLLIVAQTVAARRIDQIEEQVTRVHDTTVKQSLDDVLPTIERLHRHLIALTMAYRTTSHTQSLAQRGDRKAAMPTVRETEDMVRKAKAAYV